MRVSELPLPISTPYPSFLFPSPPFSFCSLYCSVARSFSVDFSRRFSFPPPSDYESLVSFAKSVARLRLAEPRHATRVVETRLEDAQDANISSMYARSSLSRIQFRFGRPKPNCLTCRVGRKIMLPAWLLYRRPVLWPISLRSARFLATVRAVS